MEIIGKQTTKSKSYSTQRQEINEIMLCSGKKQTKLYITQRQ